MDFLSDKSYFIWGTGFKAEQINSYYIEQLKHIKLIGYIDNDLTKQKELFYNKRVYHPDILLDNRESYIIIANKYYEEIKAQIENEYPWYKDRIVESLFFEKLQLITRYKSSQDSDIQNILYYLKEHPLQVFNYSFVENYIKEDFDIKFDSDKRLYYTIYLDKKMYFSKDFKNEGRVREYLRSICLEQDINSPHKYLTDTFTVPNNAVVIDAGVAEGNFALSIVDRVKKIYLFEPDTEWAEALKYTFEPYMDKVVIINKGISNYINGSTTTIDETIGDLLVDFIKMDIEGEEFYALQGAEKCISSSKHMKCVICTYHQEFAYQAIKGILNSFDFHIETSKGYMWYPDNCSIMRPPVLRRGVIRAEK